MSTSRVSIIRTEPSDEYASTLMGTRLVIIAVVAIGQLLMTMKTGRRKPTRRSSVFVSTFWLKIEDGSCRRRSGEGGEVRCGGQARMNWR